ncbi:hypothetical protein ACIG0D_16885 [Streptomyces sp. NPDC052773]|uniref:hypothetical protein n=1 Tax=Streptomyces sp. NPDC052773 TaxID=3365693 RepID=UPI0037CECEB4
MSTDAAGEDERLRTELGRVAPEARAVLATLALRRLSLVVEEDRFAEPLPDARPYLRRALAYCVARMRQEVTDLGPRALRAEYEALVKVDGDYAEEPEGPAAWSTDVLDVADYAVTGWHGVEDGDNEEACLDALIAVDSFVDMVEEMSPPAAGKGAPPLTDLEAVRRSRDLEAVRGCAVGRTVTDPLDEASLHLAHVYRDRLLTLPRGQ